MKNSNDKNTATPAEIEKNLEQLNYPASEDIYNQEEKLQNIDAENITTEKTVNQKEGEWNENTLNTDKDNFDGSDLDVPGSELDDQQENVGSEDEENNYYSQSDN